MSGHAHDLKQRLTEGEFIISIAFIETFISVVKNSRVKLQQMPMFTMRNIAKYNFEQPSIFTESIKIAFSPSYWKTSFANLDLQLDPENPVGDGKFIMGKKTKKVQTQCGLDVKSYSLGNAMEWKERLHSGPMLWKNRRRELVLLIKCTSSYKLAFCMCEFLWSWRKWSTQSCLLLQVSMCFSVITQL